MAAPQNVGLPPDLDLGGGYTVEFTALDPTSGNDVTAVKVSLATLTVNNMSGEQSTITLEPPTITVTPVAPLWAPLPTGIGDDTQPAPPTTTAAAP